MDLKYKEDPAAYQRAWYIKNRERILERNRMRKIEQQKNTHPRRLMTKEQRRESRKRTVAEYYRRNRDNILSKQKNGRCRVNDKYPEGISDKERMRLFYQKRKHEYIERARKRKALIRSQTGHGYNRKTVASFYAISGRVTECLGIKHHVDHITPISKGGLHHQDNLRVVPAIINLRKGDRLIAA